jgi:hypothetical protein
MLLIRNKPVPHTSLRKCYLEYKKLFQLVAISVLQIQGRFDREIIKLAKRRNTSL